MYLICCPDYAVNEINKQLATIQILGIPLVIMGIHKNLDNLEWLNDNINNYPYILLNSPTAIKLSADAIKKVTEAEAFLTVGRSSANYLQKFTNANIIFPESTSGTLALFNEKIKYLDLIGKHILILRGNLKNSKIDNPKIGDSKIGDSKIESKFLEAGINYTVLDIYDYIKLEMEAEYFKKLLLSQAPQGIIITCSLLVDWLVNYAKAKGCFELLQKLVFVTIHPNIEKKLKQTGMQRVFVTKEANRDSVVELIRNLHE